MSAQRTAGVVRQDGPAARSEHGDRTGSPDPPTSRRGRLLRAATATARSRAAGAALVATVLSLVPRLLTVGHFFHYDERTWARRSVRFSDAVFSGDFANASSAAVPGSSDGSTMPGVTTMWIGSAARGVWALGRDWGLWSRDGLGFGASNAGLTISQAAYAVVVSILLGLLTYLVARWVGPAAALIGGVLIATEPFLVANGALLHTDALVMLFGVSALVATALALGLPEPTPWSGSRWAGVVAGLLGGAALLTKLSALAVLPGAGVMVVWALVRARRAGDATTTSGAAGDGDGHSPGDGPAGDAADPDDEAGRPGAGVPAAGSVPYLGTVLRTVGWGMVTALATITVTYPALWVAPLGELENLWDSARLATGGHDQLFLGERTDNPGPLYLFVSLPIRLTPWFLVAGLATAVLIWRRPTRSHGWLLAAMGLPTFLVITFASKQFVRYSLPFLAVGAVAVGVVAVSLATGRLRTARARRLAGWAATGAAALVTAHVVSVAPWSSTYFNPALGGGSTAVEATTIGAGEGLPTAGDLIREWEGDRCDDVLIWTYRIKNAFPCGSLTSASEPERYRRADYVALYINQRQRQDPELLDDLVEGRELREVVTIRGIDMVEIYGPLPEATGPRT